MNTHPLASLHGLRFTKMTGSGNDFVFFDAREASLHVVTQPELIRAICNRFNGIGADGVVVLDPDVDGVDAQIHYFNSDGTRADLCGNATLCSTSMAATWQLMTATGLKLLTDAGIIESRVESGRPEIDLPGLTEIQPSLPVALEGGEHRIGFATAGVPHIVVLVDDVNSVDVTTRGAYLRRHSAVGAAGANVNFVAARADGSWHYRTFERGVEGETLACGTGSIATAALLIIWRLAASPVTLWTRSERPLVVRMRDSRDSSGALRPSLQGEGRVVFRGMIDQL